MAVTKGAMTNLPTSQTLFVQTVEEPEHNRINFRDSLKFFQEQLVINGANFPSPSPVSRSGNDTLRKNESRSYKEQNSDNSDISKDSDTFDGEIQSVKSCKIAIPTVDTILESVRVLRAIQKSQEERGSGWNLGVNTKSDIDSDFPHTDDWIHVSDITQDGYCNNESNSKGNDEVTPTNPQDNYETKTPVKPEINDEKQQDVTHSDNGSPCTIPYTNITNEICSFWPSNNLINGNHSEKENAISDSSFSTKMKDISPELQINVNEEFFNTEPDRIESFGQNENNFDEKTDKDKTDEIRQSDNFKEDIFLNEKDAENFIQFQNNHAEITNKSTKSCNTPDSLQSVCKDLLNFVKEKISDNEENSEEIVLKGSDSATELLKIETYEDIDTTKDDDFLLNESLWKESCSPNDSSSTKLEHNDSDSGIGTQRSASSLSPNNPSQMQKDSWSDTCSSHYASAECSPYHSLNSVFESSLGLNTTSGETKEIENTVIPEHSESTEWENAPNKFEQNIKEVSDEFQDISDPPAQIEHEKENGDNASDTDPTDTQGEFSDLEQEFHSQNAELDAEISYCSFVSNLTIEHPSSNATNEPTEVSLITEQCDTSENQPKTVNGHETGPCEQNNGVVQTESLLSVCSKDDAEEDDSNDLGRIQKFTATSCDLISIVESLYTITENPAYQVISPGDATEENFKETLFVLSKGAFCEHPEGDYVVIINDSILHISKDSQVLLSMKMKYGEVTVEMKNILKIDNRMGRCVYIRNDFTDLVILKSKIELHCLKHWQKDCLQLVHYPLKCHQNVVIIDLGSCSTRAGILMDQPTLPSLFFPTICATDKRSGTCVYGMEALQPEVRQHSNLSFPVRPTNKITKHTIDIDLLEGLFKKIFNDLKVDPTQYTVQVCLPRNLSINAQTALVKLLLEGLKVKAVSLTNQALLTLYAHDVSTAVVVDIGDRTDVLPVVDGFIVENGVTKLPHGGQQLIHHMKHGLAEKRITLSNDIDSFVVQYIIENLAYVAENYENELQISSQYPDIIKKTVTFQAVSSESISCKSITLEEARFKITEGLFNPDLWGLDSPGIHHLVQKAIQATSVDARKRIAENIYVSGGVTMLPGFVERLNKEVAKLSKTKIVPKVFASNYRYHCTYIGACKFAKMEVFPQVCINLEEYTENCVSALKKCALYF